MRKIQIDTYLASQKPDWAYLHPAKIHHELYKPLWVDSDMEWWEWKYSAEVTVLAVDFKDNTLTVMLCDTGLPSATIQSIRSELRESGQSPHVREYVMDNPRLVQLSSGLCQFRMQDNSSAITFTPCGGSLIDDGCYVD